MPSKGQKLHPFEGHGAFAVSLALSFVIIFGVACVIAYQGYMRAIDATIRTNETRATLLAKLILEHQRAAIGVLESYADRPLLVDSVKRRDFEGALNQLIDLAKRNPEMDWPFLSNPDSTVWVNHPVDRQVMNKDLSYRDWYKGVSKEWKPYISSVYKLIVGEKDLAVAIAVPIFDEKRKVIGILATAQSTDFFQKAIREVGLSADAKITLIDQEGHIIYSNGFPYTKEVADYPSFQFVAKATKGEKGGVKVRDASDGSKIKYLSFVPVEGIGWSVIVERPRSEVFRSEAPHLALIGLISALLYGVAVLSLVHFRERHRQMNELRKLNEELDDRVKERTAELEARNIALRESEERFRTLAGATFEGVAITEHGRFIDANEQFLNIAGCTRSELIGQEVASVIVPEDRDRVMANILQGMESHTEHQMFGRDGTRITVEAHGRTISYQDRQVRITAVRDITERKRAEEAMLENEERLRLAQESGNVGVWERYPTGEAYFSPETNKMYGLSAGAIRVYEDWRQRVHPDDIVRIETEREDAISRREPFDFEFRILHASGEIRWINSKGKAIRNESGEIIRLIGVNIDITNRKRIEEELRQRTLELQHMTETLEERVKERTAELANLSSQLVSAQENERKRISYDLHDNVWQTLDIVKVQIEHLFSRQGGADWAAFQRKAKQLIPVIENTIARIRSVQGDLWPYVLDDIGILATIEWYCREFKANHPTLSIEKHVDLAEDELPGSAQIVIYRVMQEALVNVAKHSRATHVSLSLIKGDHHLEFTIRDDGIGFDLGEARAERRLWGGMGILSMKQRTELSGGIFTIHSEIGKGTTIKVSWPVNRRTG